MPTSGLDAARLSRTLGETRQDLLKRDLFGHDISTGYGLSYPVPYRAGDGVGLAHFAYSAPALGPAAPGVIGRPRYWLVTEARSSRVLLFADCRLADFCKTAPYADKSWPKPPSPAGSMRELRQLEASLLEALEGFLDRCFTPQDDDLRENATTVIRTYLDLLDRLTPEPLRPYLRELSPDFWAWVEGLGDSFPGRTGGV